MINKFPISILGIGCTKKILLWHGSADDKIYFQIGCFFGSEEEAKRKIKNKYGENHIYHNAIEFLKQIPV